MSKKIIGFLYGLVFIVVYAIGNMAYARVFAFDSSILVFILVALFVAVTVILDYRFLTYSVFPYMVAIATFLASAVNGFVGYRMGFFIALAEVGMCVYALKTYNLNYERMLKWFVIFIIINYIFTLVLIALNIPIVPYLVQRYAFQRNGIFITYISGLYGDKNAFGYFNGILLLLVIHHYRFRFRAPAIALLLTTLLLSGNRGGMLAFVVAFYYYKLSATKNMALKAINMVVLPLFFGIILWMWSGSEFDTRKGSDAGRGELLEIAIPYIKDNLFFGIGRGFVVNGQGIALHNFYAQALVEAGLFTLLSYLLFFAYLVRKMDVFGKAMLIFVFLFTLTAPILQPGNITELIFIVGLCTYLKRLHEKKVDTLSPQLDPI